MSLLSKLLSSRIRAEIFRLLFGLSVRELHVREMERRSGLTVGTVRQELQKLERLELVQSRRDGNRLYYKANQAHPIYSVIRELVLKTAGLAEVLKTALQGLDIELAWVFGSIARQQEGAGSDVDLTVIGQVGLQQLAIALREVNEQIGREVNPYVLSRSELEERLARQDHFLRRVLDSDRLFVIGSPDELEAMAGIRLANPSSDQPG